MAGKLAHSPGGHDTLALGPKLLWVPKAMPLVGCGHSTAAGGLWPQHREQGQAVRPEMGWGGEQGPELGEVLNVGVCSVL